MLSCGDGVPQTVVSSHPISGSQFYEIIGVLTKPQTAPLWHTDSGVIAAPSSPTISHSVRRECDNPTRILTVGVLVTGIPTRKSAPMLGAQENAEGEDTCLPHSTVQYSGQQAVLPNPDHHGVASIPSTVVAKLFCGGVGNIQS